MTTLDKHKVTMSIRNTLPCIPLRPYTENEWEKLLHAILTSDKKQDPTVIDFEGQFHNELWFDAKSSFPDGPDDKTFNEVGDYRFRSNKHQIFFFYA